MQKSNRIYFATYQGLFKYLGHFFGVLVVVIVV